MIIIDVQSQRNTSHDEMLETVNMKCILYKTKSIFIFKKHSNVKITNDITITARHAKRGRRLQSDRQNKSA